MQKVKLGFIAIFVGLGITLALSLLLVFAQNNGLPLLRSTGSGLLGFGGKEITVANPNNGHTYVGPEGFFNNVYSFSDSSFEGIGSIVRGLYWFFCITCIGVMCLAIVSLFLKPQQMKVMLILVIVEVVIGLGIVAIAFLCILVPTFLYHLDYSYSTQYHFLLIPLIATLLAAILNLVELRKLKSQQAAQRD